MQRVFHDEILLFSCTIFQARIFKTNVLRSLVLFGLQWKTLPQPDRMKFNVGKNLGWKKTLYVDGPKYDLFNIVTEKDNLQYMLNMEIMMQIMLE